MLDYIAIMRGLREDNDVKQREVADYLLGRTKEKDYPGADRNRKLGSTKKNGRSVKNE